MSIDDPNTIDINGVERATGNLVLTISDHLEWKASAGHQLALQHKLNAYLRFVESGEAYDHKPETLGASVLIQIVGKFPPDQEGSLFWKELVR